MQINKIVDQHYKAIDFKTLSYHENSEVKQARENGEKKLKPVLKILTRLAFLSLKLPNLLVLITLM